ncbi:phospholipid carrier-dependent glycosyltransferase [bacterium]|nr:phospholipid carrier-dependent glycosyltransferase [bacterium]
MEETVYNRHALPLLLLALLTLWLRIPTIGAHLPFFDREDEAHHFNRTVRMVQSGDFNPHYFHKPSLHFYLRMPVVAASFLWSVREGHLKKVREVQTKDRYGIGGYAFTASHSGIVKWNRAFSVLLLLGTVGLVYFLGLAIGLPPFFAFGSAALFSLSPNAFLYSTQIGVDIVVTFFAVATVLVGALSLRTLTPSEEEPTTDEQRRTGRLLAGCALLAGLTVSTKYNALPIALVPLVAALLSQRDLLRNLTRILLLIPLGFFLGSPYILAEIPLFLDHLAYEIWHYGVAGHVGHQAEPGLEQAIFYLRWLFGEGLGVGGAVLALAGVFLLGITPEEHPSAGRRRVLLLLFPVLFVLLMISQRANFTRNMLVVVPFFALSAGVALSALWNVKPFRFQGLLTLVLFIGALSSVAIPTLSLRAALNDKTDSRLMIRKHLAGNPSHAVCDGRLWLTDQMTRELGCREVDLRKSTPFSLALSGAEEVVAPSLLDPLFSDSPFFEKKDEIAGEASRQRIILNPALTVWRYTSLSAPGSDAQWIKKIASDEIPLTELSPEEAPLCEEEGAEGHCWITSRFHRIRNLRSTPVSLTFQSPWKTQEITVFVSGGSSTPPQAIPFSTQSNSAFQYEIGPKDEIFIALAFTRSPSQAQLSSDPRYLGVRFTENS